MRNAGSRRPSGVRLPVMFAPAPFASGVPVLRFADACVGGAQEGWLSGAPCVRLLAAWVERRHEGHALGSCAAGRG